MIYFYARVSTKEQNLNRQLETAKAYKNIDRVFADKQSGKDFDRPEYNSLKEIVSRGDEVIIKELDRLGRDKEGIKEEIKWFKQRGVLLRILDIPTTLIDFQDQYWVADMLNNVLIEVLGAIAQQEREKTRRRQREGINAMKIINGKRVSAKNGKTYGRQPIEITPEFQKTFQKQKDGEITVKEGSEQLGISRSTWYNKTRQLV